MGTNVASLRSYAPEGVEGHSRLHCFGLGWAQADIGVCPSQFWGSQMAVQVLWGLEVALALAVSSPGEVGLGISNLLMNP